jgi:subtilisin family serine protease
MEVCKQTLFPGRAVFLLVCLVSGMLPGEAVGQDLSAYVAARQMPLSLSQQRLASPLRAAMAMVAQYGAPVASTAMSRALRLSPRGTIEVYVYVDDLTPADLQTLQQQSVAVYHAELQFRLVHAAVAVEALEVLAALPFVRWLSPPSQSLLRTGGVTSEADAVMRAAEARTALGIDGRGVRVGIISDSLRMPSLREAVTSGDLPPDVIVLDDGSDISGVADEGRAVAEIIHDLAPGATLLFHSGFDTSLSMRDAIRALTAAGASVIIDDVGFLDEPVFEDGLVAQAVQEAINNGVVYVTAAGNDAERHYRGIYQENPNDGDALRHLHDFGGGDSTMAVAIAPGTTLIAVLQWANPFDGSGTDDLDLLVFDDSGSVARFDANGLCIPPQELSGTCASMDRQATTNAPPLEIVVVTNTTNPRREITVNLVINRVAGTTSPLPLVINFNQRARVLEHNVPGGSIFGHPCVSAALAVGAIDVHDPGFDSIEIYSARGPCEIFFPAYELRFFKPDLVAADGVMTSRPGFTPFFGTSAAAPHVAAVAALLIEGAGGPGVLNNVQIASMLRQAAVDRGAVGFDHTFGFGAVDALLAVQALPPGSQSPARQEAGGGGGGGCSLLAGQVQTPVPPLAALGGILLPLVVLIVIQAWRWYCGHG